MDRRAVAKAKEKERMEAMMEARRRKKEEIAGLEDAGGLVGGGRGGSTPKAGAKPASPDLRDEPVPRSVGELTPGLAAGAGGGASLAT